MFIFFVDIPCPSTCDPNQTCVRGICVNVQNLGISLVWSRTGDGDLVIKTPNGRNIFWNNTGPSVNTDWGYLDRDDRVGIGPENIYWPSSGTVPPTGTYDVCFQPYLFIPIPSRTNPLTATITIRAPMRVPIILTKTITFVIQNATQCLKASPACLGSFTYP